MCARQILPSVNTRQHLYAIFYHWNFVDGNNAYSLLFVFWNGLTKRWQDDVTDETRYVQIQCNTGTCSQTFPCAIWLWNTLPVDASYRLTVSRPISAVSVSFERQTTSCFYPKLLFIVCCTAFCLFTHGSKSSRHRYRKMKMAVGQSRPRDVI